MPQFHIRSAVAPDVPAIEAIVRDAYGHYVERIGRKPAPMEEDYERLVAGGHVWVLAVGTEVAGLLVLKKAVDHLFVGNVAVGRTYQGKGFGRSLLDHAEAYARRNGLDELRLYTNELMHENLAIYAKLGWIEHERAEQDGFRRVFMHKRIARH